MKTIIFLSLFHNWDKAHLYWIVPLSIILLVLVAYLLERYFFRSKEVNISGEILEIKNTPIWIWDNRYNDMISPGPILMNQPIEIANYKLYLKNNSEVSEIIIEDDTLLKELKERLQKAKTSIRIHCVKILWSDTFYGKYLLPNP